jgi:hypothetical protein
MHSHNDLQGNDMFSNIARSIYLVICTKGSLQHLRVMADSVAVIAPPAFTIRSTVVIQYGTSTWVPEIQTVNDVNFIGLSKWDRSFVHFSTGRALDFRAHARKSANTEFFDRLFRAQRKASAAAIASALTADEDGDKDSAEPARKRRRPHTYPMKVLISSEMLGPPTVTIDIDGHTFSVLCKLRSKSLWMELTESNLSFIRAGTLESIDKSGRSWGRAQSQAHRRHVSDHAEEETEHSEEQEP